mgnify:FL=1
MSRFRFLRHLILPFLLAFIASSWPAAIQAQQSQPPEIFVIIQGHAFPRTDAARGPIASVSNVWTYGCSSTSTYIQFQPTPAHIIRTLAVDSTNLANWAHILANGGLDGYASCYYGYCQWVLCGKSARNGSTYDGWSYRLWDDPSYLRAANPEGLEENK